MQHNLEHKKILPESILQHLQNITTILEWVGVSLFSET